MLYLFIVYAFKHGDVSSKYLISLHWTEYEVLNLLPGSFLVLTLNIHLMPYSEQHPP